MPAYMAIPWFYSVVTAHAPVGSDARLEIDRVLGTDPDAEVEINKRRRAVLSQFGEVV